LGTFYGSLPTASAPMDWMVPSHYSQLCLHLHQKGFEVGSPSAGLGVRLSDSISVHVGLAKGKGKTYRLVYP